MLRFYRGKDRISAARVSRRRIRVSWEVVELSSGILVLNSALRDARTRKFHLKSLPLPESHAKKPPPVSKVRLFNSVYANSAE